MWRGCKIRMSSEKALKFGLRALVRLSRGLLEIIRNNSYLPWAFKKPTATTTPQTAPTRNDPELTANTHNVAAAQVSVGNWILLV